MHACLPACLPARTHARTHAHMHACAHARTHAHTHARKHGCIGVISDPYWLLWSEALRIASDVALGIVHRCCHGYETHLYYNVKQEREK